MSTFAPHLGTEFAVAGEGVPPLTLTAVDKASGGMWPDRRAPFSLLFSCPRQSMLLQGIHTLEHPILGRIDLFLVPIEPDTRGARYEAVFT
jgi:hypothetical protein